MRLALSLALAALLALASTAPARAQEADEPEEGGLTVLAPSEVPVERPVEAWIRAEPAEVEVGQPMRWHVEVHHPADLRPTVAEEPRVHDSWYLLSFDGART